MPPCENSKIFPGLLACCSYNITMKKNPPIFIVRGVPNSGKTPFCEMLSNALGRVVPPGTGPVVCVDEDSFWWPVGICDSPCYKYDERLEGCTTRHALGGMAFNLLETPELPLIVEGVFFLGVDWAMKQFLGLAKKFERDVVIIRTEMHPTEADYAKCDRPSNHTLPPPERIEEIRRKFEPIRREIVARDETAARICEGLARKVARECYGFYE